MTHLSGRSGSDGAQASLIDVREEDLPSLWHSGQKSSSCYLPMLKARQGELEAVARLGPVERSRCTPVRESVPSGFGVHGSSRLPWLSPRDKQRGN